MRVVDTVFEVMDTDVAPRLALVDRLENFVPARLFVKIFEGDVEERQARRIVLGEALRSQVAANQKDGVAEAGGEREWREPVRLTDVDEQHAFGDERRCEPEKGEQRHGKQQAGAEVERC